MSFQTTFPEEVSIGHFHSLMLGVVAPRPIGFVSSIDETGHVNLAPFSFFNAFGSNPPLLIYSPARRVRDNSIKHSLENPISVKQVVINLVDWDMVEQCSLASCEYPKGVNEFEKAGLTQLTSLRVKPPRVAEAPASFECEVMQVIETGTEGGAANLVLCKILACHIAERLLTDDGKIDHLKLDMAARMGGDYYARVTEACMFPVPKPNVHLGIGFDSLPVEIRTADFLSRNEKARLANLSQIPELPIDLDMPDFTQVHRDIQIELVRKYIASNQLDKAWHLTVAVAKSQML